jgi:hypothetical protein
MAQSSMTTPEPSPREYRYLKPSVFLEYSPGLS